MDSYHNIHYQKKNDDPIMRKLCDGWMGGQMHQQTDRRTDGQIGDSGFIGCCPTNIECQTSSRRLLMCSRKAVGPSSK